LLAAALVAGGVASCSAQPKGALMLAISTDMQTPKDLPGASWRASEARLTLHLRCT
jgi:hypothetical protein